MDHFCLQGLISCELSITAWVWGAKEAEGEGVGVALMLGLSALGGFTGVQNSRMDLLTSIQGQREFPYVRDRAGSLYNTYLQVWKEAKIILTTQAIVCTYNFLVVLLNLGFLNKHFGKSSSPSHAVWSTLHSSDSQDTKGVCFYQSILEKSSPLVCSVTKLAVLYLYSLYVQ